MFVDRAKITVRSGKGGDGCVSFRREPYVPAGGPDGGDGGKGGDVVFVVDKNLRTLMDFRYKRKYEAESGQDGMKKKKFGKNGEDLIVRVPPGTVVIDGESGLIMKDLIDPGDRVIAAKGGKGGKGNVNFKTAVRQAPNFAEAGTQAKERSVILELKLIADVGIIGFPNVGKSTLLSAATNAKPKIANYPFTTIAPNLGVVSIFESSFVMADIAGLIEGASEGAGLGHEFLKHIERTKLLIHVVDISGSEGRDAVSDYEKINKELELFNIKLSEKSQIVAANKIDLIGENDEKYIEFKKYIGQRGQKVFPVSAATNAGLNELLAEVSLQLSELEKTRDDDTNEIYDFEKEDADENYREIFISKDNDVFVLAGGQLEKIFNSTNFNDTGSLRYLYRYIEKKGALDKLKEMGLEEGGAIRIKGFEFEYFED